MSRTFKRVNMIITLLVAFAFLLMACAPAATPTTAPAEQPTTAPAEQPTAAESSGQTTDALNSDKAAVAMQFFSQEEMDRDIKFRTDNVQPMGPEGEPWVQYLIDNPIDRSLTRLPLDPRVPAPRGQARQHWMSIVQLRCCHKATC